MSTQNSKGFTACGVYYVMGDDTAPYIEYLKSLLNEIRQNYLEHRK